VIILLQATGNQRGIPAKSSHKKRFSGFLQDSSFEKLRTEEFIKEREVLF
jgi:hypothetical protein